MSSNISYYNYSKYFAIYGAIYGTKYPGLS